MGTLFRLQLTTRTADSDPKNFVTNTLHFDADNSGVLSTILAPVVAGMNLWRPQMSALAAQNNHPYKFYDMTQPEPRAPVLEGTWSFIAAPTGAAMPPEVALCCSFQAARVSGIPQARRRGRVFLAFPSAAASDTTGRPGTVSVNAAVAFGDSILEASKASTTWKWIVASSFGSTPGGYVIANGWVDNEWDTQRRRGRLATFRTVFN